MKSCEIRDYRVERIDLKNRAQSIKNKNRVERKSSGLSRAAATH